MRTPRNKKTAEEILRRYKRGDKEFRNVSVQAEDLSRRRLVGIVFEGASLMGSNFERSILKQASFSAANLREVGDPQSKAATA